MDVHFKMEVAKETGVDGAIMLEYFRYWILKNKANEKHFYDGKYWTYNSMEAFTTLFPIWSRRQIDRILRNLKDGGYIETGNYNKSAYDRTLWYTLTEKSLILLYSQEENPFTQMGNSISPNGEMEITEEGNGNYQTVQPIPIKLPVNTTVNNNTNKTTKSKEKNEIKVEKEFVDTVIKKWNDIGLNTVRSIKGKRLDSLHARIKEYSKDDVLTVIENVKYSDFLKGNNNRNWTADIDWILKPNNFIKVLEGNYNKSKGIEKKNNPSSLNANSNYNYDINSLIEKMQSEV